MAEKKEKVAEAAAPVSSKKDVELKDVKVVYIDNPARLERVFAQRKAEGRIDNIGKVFVHLTVEKDGVEYSGLSQTLRVLGQDDYTALLKAYAEQTPIDLTVRMDSVSQKTGNYFFFVNHGEVTIDDLFKEPFDKPMTERKNVVDLLTAF